MNRFIIVMCTAVLFCTFHLSAQQNSADSLKNVLNRVYGGEKIRVQLQLSRELIHSNPSDAIKYGEEALKLSKKLENDSLATVALSQVATLYDILDKDAKAVTYYLSVLRIYEDKDLPEKQGSTLFNLGNLYYYQNNYPKALEYFYRALEIFEKIDAGVKASTTIFRIGMVFQNREDPGKALEYYFNALEKSKKAGNFSMSAQISATIADVYLSIGNKKNAIAFLNKALQFSDELPGKPGKHAKAMILMEISSIYKSDKSYKKAFAYNKEALNVAKSMNNAILMALSYENRARIYADKAEYITSNFYLKKSIALLEAAGYNTQVVQNRLFLAKNYFILGKYKMSVSQADLVRIYAEETKKAGLKKEALQQLTASQIALKNYAEALRWQQGLVALNDSLYAVEKTEQIAKMRVQYEIEKAERDLLLAQKAHEKKSLLFKLALAGLFLILLLAILIFSRQRLRIRNKRIALENSKLQEKQMEQDLETKNRELTTYTLSMIQKNGILKEVHDKMLIMEKNSKNGITKEIKEVTNSIGHHFNHEKEWKDFNLYFENVHTEFFSRLEKKHPYLSTKDHRLCALLKLKLTIKETADLLGISPSSVKMARYRLRQKLNLKTEENLADYLNHLDRKAIIR